MKQRKPNPPLIVGMVISVLAHWGALSMDIRRLDEPTGLLKVFESKSVPAQLPVMALGVNRPRGASMSLISFDEFRALIAPSDAPTESENNPTPENESPTAVPQTAESAKKVVQRVDHATRPQTQTPSPAQTTDSETPLEDRVAQQQPQTEPAPDQPAAAPAWQGDATPLRLQPYAHKLQPGGTVTIDGVTIKTVKPDIAVIMLLPVPRDAPVARIIFDPRTGRTMTVILEQTTGDPTQDAPIVESLYRWRVSGRRLAWLTRPIEVKVELILVDQ